MKLRETPFRPLALVALLGCLALVGACDLPLIQDPTPPPPPVLPPTSVVTLPAGAGGAFQCGGGMTCGPATVLVGERDGTSCERVSEGFCASVQTTTNTGAVFSAVHTTNCESLPSVGCGEPLACPGGKVLVGYSDGTGCGVRNSGQCCNLVTDVGLRPLTPTTCSVAGPTACGGKSQCAAGQAMVSRLDGGGCGIPNQITCCNMGVQ